MYFYWKPYSKNRISQGHTREQRIKFNPKLGIYLSLKLKPAIKLKL